jgi:hypothetical protein
METPTFIVAMLTFVAAVAAVIVPLYIARHRAKVTIEHVQTPKLTGSTLQLKGFARVRGVYPMRFSGWEWEVDGGVFRKNPHESLTRNLDPGERFETDVLTAEELSALSRYRDGLGVRVRAVFVAGTGRRFSSKPLVVKPTKLQRLDAASSKVIEPHRAGGIESEAEGVRQLGPELGPPAPETAQADPQTPADAPPAETS